MKKKLLTLLFFLCVAFVAYVDMDNKDITPQGEEQEMKHVRM